jgi:hypothetical protein
MGINNVFEVEETLGFGSTPMSFHCIANQASCFSPPHSNDEVFVEIGAAKKLSSEDEWWRADCARSSTMIFMSSVVMHLLSFLILSVWN